MTRVGACVPGDRLGVSITNSVYSADVDFWSCFICCLEPLIARHISQIKDLDIPTEKSYPFYNSQTIQLPGQLSAQL